MVNILSKKFSIVNARLNKTQSLLKVLAQTEDKSKSRATLAQVNVRMER